MVDRVLENFFILLGRAHLSQYFVFHFDSRPSNFSLTPKTACPLLFYPILVTCTNLHFTTKPVLNDVVILRFLI